MLRVPHRTMFVVVLSLLLMPKLVCADQVGSEAYHRQLLQTWSWAREDWSGDDAPYQQVMSEIDRVVTKGKNLDLLLTNYKVSAGYSIANPIPQFRWAYMGYKISLLPNRTSDTDPIGLSADALARPQSPHSYSYDRLKYLIWHQIGAYNYHMVGIGKRLLRLDPSNQRIMLWTITDLTDSRDDFDRSKHRVAIDRAEALTLAKRYVTRFPQSPGGYSALGNVYSEMFLSANSPADRKNAVLALKQYAKMVSPNTAAFDQTQIFIKRIEGGLALYHGRYIYKDSLPQ